MNYNLGKKSYGAAYVSTQQRQVIVIIMMGK